MGFGDLVRLLMLPAKNDSFGLKSVVEIPTINFTILFINRVRYLGDLIVYSHFFSSFIIELKSRILRQTQDDWIGTSPVLDTGVRQENVSIELGRVCISQVNPPII
jgi:hypothetical protein